MTILEVVIVAFGLSTAHQLLLLAVLGPIFAVAAIMREL